MINLFKPVQASSVVTGVQSPNVEIGKGGPNYITASCGITCGSSCSLTCGCTGIPFVCNI